MVGQEDDRLPVRWNLQGTGDHALAGQFLVAHPCQCRATQAHPDPVALRGHLVRLGRQGPERLGREPVRAGARQDAQLGGARQRAYRRHVDRQVGESRVGSCASNRCVRTRKSHNSRICAAGDRSRLNSGGWCAVLPRHTTYSAVSISSNRMAWRRRVRVVSRSIWGAGPKRGATTWMTSKKTP